MKQQLNDIKLFNEPIQISQLSVAIEILRVYNPRASEILSAKWSNFFPDRFLLLEGKKHSSNVIIRDRVILQLIKRLPKIDDILIFPSLNYYHLYRHVKQYYSHLFKKWKKRKNYKVTHGFRYKAVEPIGIDTEIRDILHHRSTKSGKYYKLK